ncbi:acyltransferase [Bradyrhizobium sp. ISRA437]|uniref:acyltransferase family protein n=1 Tax=Bradyrhizobium sp. ISRA437 TaxID=2866196 RepID=UPI0024786EE8|nr:acyltransferase [Bradyrhizobium sp. ISRA437]WGS04155.1 acyltransferase [Bradyrhizobium sp. ISRA437]
MTPGTALDQRSSKQLLTIQYLRGVASVMVVLHHIRNPWPNLYNPLEKFAMGEAGVDIFFIISGVVMYVSSRVESPAVFAGLRLIRVAPLYWILTLCAASLLLLSGGAKPGFALVNDVMLSAMFVPHHSSIFPGTIWPVLNPGWTLYFEMFFYLIFAIGLLFRKPLLISLCLISLLVAFGLFVSTDESIFHSYTHPLLMYTHPLMLEFAGGIVLGWLFLSGMTLNVWLLLPMGFVALFAVHALQLPHLFLLNGLCAALIMVGAVAAERSFKMRDMGWLRLLGDASYSIYLTHALTLFVFRRLFLRLPLEGPLQFASFAILAATVSLLVGFVVYFKVERPMTRWLRSQFLTVFAVARGGTGRRLPESGSSVSMVQPLGE